MAGQLPLISDAEEWDDFLFADDEALYSQLVDDATSGNTNTTGGGDDDCPGSSCFFGFDNVPKSMVGTSHRSCSFFIALFINVRMLSFIALFINVRRRR